MTRENRPNNYEGRVAGIESNTVDADRRQQRQFTKSLENSMSGSDVAAIYM